MLLDISLEEMLAEAVTMLSAATLAGASAYVCIHTIRLIERTGMRLRLLSHRPGYRAFLYHRVKPMIRRSERNVVLEIGII